MIVFFKSCFCKIQKGSGAYTLEYNPQFTNVYDGIQNVIAILEGSAQFHGILLNCHYDSLPTSDGKLHFKLLFWKNLEYIQELQWIYSVFF